MAFTSFGMKQGTSAKSVGFKRLPTGAHVCKVLGISHYVNNITGSESLKLTIESVDKVNQDRDGIVASLYICFSYKGQDEAQHENSMLRLQEIFFHLIGYGEPVVSEKDFSAKEGKSEFEMKGSNGESLKGKLLGVVTQVVKEIDGKNESTNVAYIACFNPETRQTANEVQKNKPAKQIDIRVKDLEELKVTDKSKGKKTPKESFGAKNTDEYDDDVPFGDAPVKSNATSDDDDDIFG